MIKIIIITVTVDDGVKVKMACYKFVALKKSIKQTKQNKTKFMSFSCLFQDWGPAFVPQGIWYIFENS